MLGRFSDADERPPGYSRLTPPKPNSFIKASRIIMPLNSPGFAATRLQRRSTPISLAASPPGRQSRTGWRLPVLARGGHLDSRRLHGGERLLPQALDASRRGRAGLEFEARMPAFQADNLMRGPRRARR